MTKPSFEGGQRFLGNWVWLFPLTYLVHIAEEYWLDEGFPAWISRVVGADLTPDRFLTLNVFAWILMSASMVIGVSVPALSWLVTGFGTVVTINALAHLIGSFVTRSFSPGVISGIFLWLPLGLFTLRRSWMLASRRSFWIGVGLGVMLHGVITLLAFGVG